MHRHYVAPSDHAFRTHVLEAERAQREAEELTREYLRLHGAPGAVERYGTSDRTANRPQVAGVARTLPNPEPPPLRHTPTHPTPPTPSLQHTRQRREAPIFPAPPSALVLHTTLTTTWKTPDPCIICLEPMKMGDPIRKLRCKHAFHATCIDKWLKGHVECPVCRRDFRRGGGVS